jgi:uncharacterized membrane protein YphA (DoxX/SURF4 family)
MNVVLWILQAALAFLYLAGGAYKVFKVDELTNHVRALPRGGWRALGVLEMLGGILLIVPAATALAAAVLALETLTLAWIYAGKSLKLVAANPFVWAAVMGLLVAFVAYGRYALTPLA